MPRDESLAAVANVRTVDDDALLTVHDAARLLNVSVSWVYEHTRDNCSAPLPFVKLGKYLRFDARDLRAYVDSKREVCQRVRRRRG